MYLGLHLIFRLKTLAKGIGDRSYAVEVDRPHLPLHPLKQAALAIARRRKQQGAAPPTTKPGPPPSGPQRGVAWVQDVRGY